MTLKFKDVNLFESSLFINRVYNLKVKRIMYKKRKFVFVLT